MTKSGRSRDVERTIEARRVVAVDMSSGDFTYAVLPEPAPGPGEGERRGAPRKRTRLRSGKIVDGDGHFLMECLVYDLSDKGGRLRIAGGATLPRTIQLFDDQSGALHCCAILWRDGTDVGIRFEPQRHPLRARDVANGLRRKFYAVRD